MPSNLLTAILEKHGEAAFKVRRCILVKIGVVQVEDTSRKINEVGKTSFDDLLKSLVKAVALHPNVSEPQLLSSGSGAMTLPGPQFLLAGDHFLFHVTLPKSQLQYPDWCSSDEDMEDFYAIYTGSLFAAFREIEFGEQHAIGQEFRELLLKTQIPKTTIKIEPLGPSPLHPDFYLLIGTSNSEGPRHRPAIFCENRNVFIVLHGRQEATKEIVDEVFSQIERSLFIFYDHSVLQVKADRMADDISHHFSRLAQGTRKLDDHPKWNIFRTRELTREVRTELSRIHELLVTREFLLLDFGITKEHHLQRISEHPILSSLRWYFKEQYDTAEGVPQSLIPALQYFENELALGLNIRTLFVATILGALAGAIIGALLTWALGK